jgi:hypothetical protein
MEKDTVKMTKPEGDAIATANVPADQVDVWKEAGWRVEVKAKK